MIKSFEHKGLKKFFQTGSKAGIPNAHTSKLSRQLSALDAADNVAAMDFPGWNLHPLKGKLKGHWSVTVNGNWRMTFRFEDGDAILVNYQDYH
jgi:proteic killer suppression protein